MTTTAIITNSDMNTYQTCPRQWYLRSVRRLKPNRAARTGALPFGSRIHRALEMDEKGEMGALAAWDALIGFDTDVLLASGAATDDIEKEADLGALMLSGYQEWNEESGFHEEYEVMEVEHPLSDLLHVPEIGRTILVRGKLDRLLRRRADGALYIGDFKAQPLTEPVATPSGWTTMGELRAGDLVLGSDYTPTTVLSTHDLGMDDVYRVEFNDKTWVRASGDHLWQTGRGVVSTRDLRFGKQPGHNDTVAQITPGRGPSVVLPMDPYVLGAWIGDGGRLLEGRRAKIYGSPYKIDVLNAVAASSGYPVDTEQFTARADIVHRDLLAARSPERWIPMEYLRASYDQRLSLLRGLMDTDGCCSKQSRSTQFQTTSPRLADDVADLVRSLGGRAAVAMNPQPNRYGNAATGYIVTGTYLFRVAIRLGVNPFLHKSQARDRWRAPRYANKIVSAVVADGREDVRCIRVSAPDHLYLTRYLVVTHNTIGTFSERDIGNLYRSPQPRLYSMLVRQQRPQEEWVAGAVYTLLRKVKRTARANPPFYAHERVQISDYDLEQYRLRMVAMARRIAVDTDLLADGADHRTVVNFHPTWQCQTCPFRAPCDLMNNTSMKQAEEFIADNFTEGDPWERYDVEPAE